MKITQLGLKTRREKPKEIESINADLLIRAGFIDQTSTGVYSFLPLGLKTLNNIIDIIRNEINALGANELLLPALHSSDFWKKTGRYDVDVSFKTKSNTGQEYVFGWTHEEIITPLAKRYINSYRDLPISLYQFQDKFRDELRAKSGLLRTREFIMKDLYSFHANQECMDSFYEKAAISYKNIFEQCGIGNITYKTYASGGDFSKYSHEFQTVSMAGEDTIFICDKCKIAINKEIINEVNKCPECQNNELKAEKAIEVGNIFKLGNRFSEAFDLKFADESGKQHFPIMGCYGIGPARVMGTIVEAFNDENGIIWPKHIAPFDVHLIMLGNDKEIIEEAERVYKKLESADISVLFDDRDESAGTKFADCDLIGLPIRLVISNKTESANSYGLKQRISKEEVLIEKDHLIKKISELLS